MRTAWATLRFSLTILTLFVGVMLMVVTSWRPLRVGRYTLPFWLEKLTAVSILFILNVRVTAVDAAKIQQHHGLLFPNHVSYLDIFVLLCVTPTRFLAKAEIRRWPLIGWAATAVGCVYVERGDQASRHRARAAVAQADHFPPITIFPEGTRGPGKALLPFRYGAFEIAAHGRIPYLPLAIVYDDVSVAQWRRGRGLLGSFWHFCGRTGRLTATLHPLAVAHPAPGADAAQLATAAQAAMTAVFQQHHIDFQEVA